jgi:ElaB/YqjD/DUF883 family membrane-anchored ribosome-binding protein
LPDVYLGSSAIQEDKVMWGQKQEAEDRSARRSDGGGNGALVSSREAGEAIEKLRSGIEQASGALRDLTQAGEHWAQALPQRARDMAKELRSQGERAVGTVSQKVEHNPVTSLAVAFAVGFICAMMVRR